MAIDGPGSARSRHLGVPHGADDLPSYESASDTHNHQWSSFGTAENGWSNDINGNSIEMIDWNDGFGNEGSGIYAPAHSGAVSTTIQYYIKNDTPYHPVSPTSGSANQGSNLPGYVGLLKLMRID